MTTITIIIPVYNVAAYLPKCIESVLEQSFLDFEVLLIDDGSTDESPSICDRYAAADLRIRVIHQSNHGVSYARNIAIDEAKGQYITFIDGDDRVSAEYLSVLYEALQNNPEAYISLSEYYREQDGELLLNYSFVGIRVYDSAEAVYHLYRDNEIKNYVWGKLYRKQLFDGIRFPEDRRICEDMAVLYKLFYASGKIVHIPEPAYFYQIRQGSSINSGNKLYNDYQYWKSRFEMFNFIREKNLFYDKLISDERALLRMGLRIMRHCFKTKYADRSIVNDVSRSMYNLKLRDVGIKLYLTGVLIRRNPSIYKRICF